MERLVLCQSDLRAREGGSARLRIAISCDGVRAGTGRVVDGRIEDCAAVLGEDQDASDETYAAIEEQIEAGDTEGTVDRPDGRYTWEVRA